MTIKKPSLADLEKKYGKLTPYAELPGYHPFTFGRFVRMARHDLELTQVEFAKKLGMAAGTLCDIEKGRQGVSIILAVKIAKLAKLSQESAVRYALQDQLDRAKIKMKVSVQSA
jgi:DNA-binding XRE family transcriptional regulator